MLREARSPFFLFHCILGCISPFYFVLLPYFFYFCNLNYFYYEKTFYYYLYGTCVP